jgi:site-specific recombinase XerD
MDEWAWEQLQPWLDARAELPVGPLFGIVTGPTRGRAWSNTAVRAQLRHFAAQAGVRRRFAPYRLRHAHAVEMAREGVPLVVIQRQLGQTLTMPEALEHKFFGALMEVWSRAITAMTLADIAFGRRGPGARCCRGGPHRVPSSTS